MLSREWKSHLEYKKSEIKKELSENLLCLERERNEKMSLNNSIFY
jgi:hypothetical protein